MSRKHRQRKIGDLLKRAESGEVKELRLRSKDDDTISIDEPAILARAAELVDDWQQGRPLSQDDRDFLMYILLDYELGPAHAGRNEDKPAKTTKREALAAAHAEYQRLRKHERKTADQAAAMVRDQFQDLFPGKLTRFKPIAAIKRILQHY